MEESCMKRSHQKENLPRNSRSTRQPRKRKHEDTISAIQFKKQKTETSILKLERHLQQKTCPKSLQYKQTKKQTKKTTGKILPFVTAYHPGVKNLKQILMQEWNLIQNQPLLKTIYKTPPIISYKRGKSLKDILVRAKL